MAAAAGDGWKQPSRRRPQALPYSSDSSDSERISDPSTLCNEKVVAAGHNITVSIGLLEPVLFLESYERHNPASRKTAMLRGYLRLKLLKPSKIKKVYLQFRGIAVTSWPEGNSSKRGQYQEHTHGIMNHTWTFFNAQFPAAEQSYGTAEVHFSNDYPSLTTNELRLPAKIPTPRRLSVSSDSPGGSLNGVPPDRKRLSLHNFSSLSFELDESPSSTGATVSQKGFKWFPPGDYVFNFELPLDSWYPQTFRSDIATIKYELAAMVERSGVFRPNLIGIRETPVIRTPAEGSLEHVEPIAITRTWDDQLLYEVIISGKAFPLGAKVPVAIKLTPLAKVACHRIRVYVTESIQQRAQRKSTRHYDITKKLLLFEKRPNAPFISAFPGSSMRTNFGTGTVYNEQHGIPTSDVNVISLDKTSLLGNIEAGIGAGSTELEFDVQLPTCRMIREGDPARRLHCDIDYEHLAVSHCIKIILRLSRHDESNPNKRRHFEISIDSPFHIISCLARQANVCVPAYTTPSSIPSEGFECGCPDFPLAAPPSGIKSPPLSSSPLDNPMSRPIHLLRLPSYSPPAFDDVQPPPPLGDPPPEYASIVPQNQSMEEYFDQLHRAEMEYDDITRGPGRVDVPLTPGGRVHRSMDLCREREFIDSIDDWTR